MLKRKLNSKREVKEMNNKFLLFGILALLLFVNGVFAKDVAYVVKTAQNPQIISILNELNYSYDVFTDSQVPNANFSSYSVLLIQDSITNKQYLPLNSKNLLFINKDYAPLVWTQGTVIAGSSNIFSAKLDQLGTPFTLGLNSINFDAYTTPKPDYYLHVYPAGITSVARSTGATGEYPIIAYSNINNSRKVFFGFYSIDYWSGDSKKLFKNSLNWTRLGVDGDKDGYYSDVDCNDNDATKWRNLPGYRDVDGDSLGAGNSLQVCSGNNLPTEYSNVSTDCNDNDATKWRNLPGYLDADGDGIGGGNLLQVCSGNNLPNGYSQSGGDCNDNDANVWMYINGYVDSDLDGRGSGDMVRVCSNGISLPAGYSNSGTDCNDSDSSVWRLLNGYLDEDDDDFGVGNALEVCSGFNLAPGFSSNNNDCNDSHSSINPGAVEIPYDGIDQTCKGYDLADVDSDGYCKAGYVIQNLSLQCAKESGLIGTDCNDNESSYNIASKDLLKNCKNEAPIISMIDSIRIKETELVNLTINATDPDDDNLSYFINDSRFYQNPDNLNSFVWQTDYSDRGSHIVEIRVSDGQANVTKNVGIEVLRTNRKPACNEIPEIQVDEDKNVLIDLKEYCYDDDADDLTYSIVGNTNLIESISNGIASLSGVKDYFGEQSVLFKISDGIDIVDINVSLKINQVNDAVVFNGTISAVEFNEGSNSTNAFNLNNYFKDIDSNLSFNFTGNNNLDIRLHNGYVSFYPINNFVGTETIIFSASDEEFTIYSNPVKIDVKDINMPPVFSDLNCLLSVSEDTSYQCELSASDVENDSFSFSIEGKSKMNCSIQGNILKYISEKDQTGAGNCKIRVTDIRNASNEKVINFSITNVNDVPVIKDYYPKTSSVKVLGNTEKRFTIFASDIDSNFNIAWKLGEEVVGNLSNYNFIKTKGNYVLTAVVSDGEYSTNQVWNIFVGDVNDFTCSEMSGHVCNENQTCSNGQVLNVSDTNSCCSVACSAKPPQFKSIRNMSLENKTSNIKINSITPESGEKKYLGDQINSSVKIENSMSSMMDMDLQIYIYDTTREKIIDKISDDAKINSGSYKVFDFSYTLDDDLKESDSYYIFIRAIGKDNDNKKYYNEIYEKLNVDRKDSDLVITDVVIPQYGIVCGDEISVKVVVENLGKNYQFITLKTENSELGLNLVTESFRVGGYKEESEKEITLPIPANAKEGAYTLKFSFGNYNNNQVFEKEINLDQCANQINTLKSIETIKINPQSSDAISSPGNDNIIPIVVGILSIAVMVTILVVLTLYLKNIDLSNEGYNEFGILDATPVETNIRKVKKKSRK